MKLKLDENLPTDLTELFASFQHDADTALGPIDDWSGCFVVISDRKLRIRRP